MFSLDTTGQKEAEILCHEHGAKLLRETLTLSSRIRQSKNSPMSRERWIVISTTLPPPPTASTWLSTIS
jgi:hypothetical protein